MQLAVEVRWWTDSQVVVLGDLSQERLYLSDLVLKSSTSRWSIQRITLCEARMQHIGRLPWLSWELRWLEGCAELEIPHNWWLLFLLKDLNRRRMMFIFVAVNLLLLFKKDIFLVTKVRHCFERLLAAQGHWMLVWMFDFETEVEILHWAIRPTNLVLDHFLFPLDCRRGLLILLAFIISDLNLFLRKFYSLETVSNPLCIVCIGRNSSSFVKEILIDTTIFGVCSIMQA